MTHNHPGRETAGENLRRRACVMCGEPAPAPPGRGTPGGRPEEVCSDVCRRARRAQQRRAQSLQRQADNVERFAQLNPGWMTPTEVQLRAADLRRQAARVAKGTNDRSHEG